MCGLMCKKINQIPSIEVSDKDHFKKTIENVTLTLENYLDMLIVIKEKETWSIKVIDVKNKTTSR